MKQVAIIGTRGDDAARYVSAAVERRGGTPVWVETDRIPETVSLSWEDGHVLLGPSRLSDVRSFYVKTLRISLPAPEPAVMAERNFQRWQDQYLAERERQSLLYGVLHSLSLDAATFINPVEAIAAHGLKLQQLDRLRRAGLPVPPSLASSSPEAVRDFASRHGNVIYKPLAGGAMVRRLQCEDLEGQRLELLGNSPVLFQAEIPGEEFRAYVLDGEPVAAFQIPTEGVVDARANISQVRPAELPSSAWELCLQAASTLGMVFAAVDLRRTPDGAYVLFECNPTPAISFFDDPHEGEVISRLADHLVSHA